MKKVIMVIGCMMASASVFAQVDSTVQSTPSDTTSQAAVESDTTSGSAMGSSAGQMTKDSTSAAGSDSTSTESGTAVGSSAASDTSAAITDEDLRKYAVVMDSVNNMKKNLLAEITSMVKSNANMKLSRYNELNKAMKDEAKLKEIKATPQEIEFMKKVDDRKNEGAQQISETFQSLAKDYIGVEKYNKIKTSLESDPQIKARYDQVMSEVQGGDTASSR